MLNLAEATDREDLLMNARISSKLGVWIDRERAIIVTLGDPLGIIRTVTAAGDDRYREPADDRSADHPGHRTVGSETRQNRRRQEEQRRFYRRVIEHVRPADRILVLGPGTAKHGFCRELARAKPAWERSVEVRTAPRMTDCRLFTEVWQFFEGDEVKRSA